MHLQESLTLQLPSLDICEVKSTGIPVLTCAGAGRLVSLDCIQCMFGPVAAVPQVKGETFPLPPSRTIAAPLGLLGSVLSLEVVQN